MRQIIIYPFSVQHDNTDSYLKTLELAKKKNIKVVCFTSVEREQNMDQAYLHLLHLNGVYQTKANSWSMPDVKVEPQIRQGEFEIELLQYLEEEELDVVFYSSFVDDILSPSFVRNVFMKNENHPAFIRYD